MTGRMIVNSSVLVLAAFLAFLGFSSAFVNPHSSGIARKLTSNSRILSTSTDIDAELSKLQLTPVLEGYVKGLRNVADDKVRYQQLFFLASKCQPMDVALKTDENKVPGCLSTVHIHARREDDKIYYLGDSDAQMTKGLVAMLVNGLSGQTNAQIQQVNNTA